MELDQATLDKLKTSLPTWAVEGGQLYAPAIARMALNEFVAWVALLNSKKLAEAQAQVREKMTAEELTAEKARLTALVADMANARADALELLNNIVLGLLKAGIILALSAGGL